MQTPAVILRVVASASRCAWVEVCGVWGAQLVWRASIAPDTTHRPTPCCCPPPPRDARRGPPRAAAAARRVSHFVRRGIIIQEFAKPQTRGRGRYCAARFRLERVHTAPFTTARGAVRGNIRCAHRPEQRREGPPPPPPPRRLSLETAPRPYAAVEFATASDRAARGASTHCGGGAGVVLSRGALAAAAPRLAREFAAGATRHTLLHWCGGRHRVS